MLKYELHIIYMRCYKLLLFFQPFKSQKPSFSSWVIHKWVMAQIWPTGHSLLTPELLDWI